MTPKPVGTFILIELPAPEEKSKGGIILTDDTAKREQKASEQGTVIAIGPCAFKGWAGCESPNAVRLAWEGIPPGAISTARFEAEVEHFKWHDPESPPHKQWGIDVGDHVEFRKYEGKQSVIEGYDRYRYIPDTHIVGRVDK